MMIRKIFRRIDWVLFLAVAFLLGLGLLAIWTVDLAQDPFVFASFKKQLAFIILGFVASFGMIFVDYRAWRSVSRLLYIFGGFILIFVVIFGITVKGTTGWFHIAGFTFQPVEIIKVILIIVLAKYLSKSAHVVHFKVILNLAIITGVYVFLVLLQPDFGSAVVLVAIAGGMLLFTQVPRRYLLWGIVIISIVSVIGWNFALEPYQKGRIVGFLDPDADPFGKGYNIRQSVIAVGSGGIFGRGLGEGSQSQLRFLPEARTDFIFAVISEQLGFIAVIFILFAYGVIVWRFAVLLRQTSEGFALFCVAGFFVLIFVQMIFNIGMNLGVFPIVGLPLPFVSLGGSALLGNFLLVGLIQSIKVRV